MKIGIDVDGVLADFNQGFIAYCRRCMDRDLFPVNYTPITWDYPQALGYTDKEVHAVWVGIKKSSSFWAGLCPYADTFDAIRYLSSCRETGDDVYFVTARPGTRSKHQTEQWLVNQGYVAPTVIMSSHKGLIAQAVGLDVYIDDRWENALSVAACHWGGEAPKCRSLLLTQPWNTNKDVMGTEIVRVDSVVGMREFGVAYSHAPAK